MKYLTNILPAAERDVVVDGIREKLRPVPEIRNHAASLILRIIAKLPPVNPDTAKVRIKPEKRESESRFAGSDSTRNTNQIPLSGCKMHILNNVDLGIRIAESQGGNFEGRG